MLTMTTATTTTVVTDDDDSGHLFRMYTMSSLYPS